MFSKKLKQRRPLTDLMVAVTKQDVDLTKALIQSGADLETRDRHCQNVLWHAFPELYGETDDAKAPRLERPTVEILRALIHGGINVNSSMDGDGCSALVTAVCLGWVQVVRLLLDNGVDMNETAMSKNDGSLSSGAARHPYVISDTDNLTYITDNENAIRGSHSAVTDNILTNNNNNIGRNKYPITDNNNAVTISNNSSPTDNNISLLDTEPLSPDAVIFYVDDDFLFKLKEPTDAYHQFIFSKGCSHCVTPLLCAVMQRRHTLVQMLLAAGASAHSLSFGTFWRASGSSVCSSCDVRISPLHMAAYMGDLKVTYELLQLQEAGRRDRHLSDSQAESGRGINGNDNECHGNNNGNNQDVGDIHTEDDGNDNNETQYFADVNPLWLALLQGHVRIVKLFLSLGRPLSVVSHFGSGLQVCLQEGHTALALMLLRAGYNLDDDLEWIEEGNYPCSDSEVIDHIEALVNQPRSLLDLSASSLRLRFGLRLDDYLAHVGAPNKVSDILHFNDLSKASWQDVLPHSHPSQFIE